MSIQRKETAEYTRKLAEDLAEQAIVAGKQASAFAAQMASQAQDLAVQGKEWAAPRVEDAATRLRPVVEDARDRAGVAKEKVVTEYIPKAKRVAKAAADAARESEGDLRTRALAVQTSATKALTDPTPKKKRRGGKLLCACAILTGAAGAVYLLWKRSQPVEDPWAEAYWQDPEDTSAGTQEAAAASETPATAPSPADAAETLAEAVEEAAAQAEEAAADAAEKASKGPKHSAESAGE